MASKHLWKTKLTANDSTAQEELGIERVEKCATDDVMKKYRYVLYAAGTAADAAAKGDVMLHSGITGYTVTTDEGDEEDTMYAGIAIGAITDAYYGWIQVGPGFCNYVKTETNVTAHAMLVPHTVDGQCVAMTNAGDEEKVFGVALADDTASVATAVWLYK